MLAIKTGWLIAFLFMIHCGCRMQKKEMPMQPDNKVNSDETQNKQESTRDRAEALLQWFKANARTPDGKRRVLRVPIAVRFRDSHQLEITDSFVISGPVSAHAMPVQLDDSGMGRSFLEIARDLCETEKQDCFVWVDGYWGRLVDNSDLEPEKHPVLAVLRVLGRVTEKEVSLAVAPEK